MGAHESKERHSNIPKYLDKSQIYATETKMRLGTFKRGSSKKRDATNRSSVITSNSQPIKNEPTNITNNKRQTDLQNGNIIRNTVSTATMKTPPVKRAVTPRRNDSTSKVHAQPLKDTNQNVGVQQKPLTAPKPTANKNVKPQGKQQPTKQDKQIQATDSNYNIISKDSFLQMVQQVKYSCTGFQSMALLLNHCASQLEAEKQKTLESKLSLEELKTIYQRLEDEFNHRGEALDDITKQNTMNLEQVEKCNEIIRQLTCKQDEINSNLLQLQQQLNIKIQSENEISEQLKHSSEQLVELGKLLRLVQDENSCLKIKLCECDLRNEKLLNECKILVETNQRLKQECEQTKENQKEEKKIFTHLDKNEENNLEKSEKSIIEYSPVKTPTKTTRTLEISEKTPTRVDSPKRISDEAELQRTPSRTSRVYCRTPSYVDEYDEEYKTPIQIRLESDVESFRQALDLKTEELKEVRQQMMKQKQESDRVPNLLSTIASLEAKMEGIQSQLSSQTETSRKLYKQKEVIEEELLNKNTQNTRLAQRVEELEYKLSMYGEAMSRIVSDRSDTCSCILAKMPSSPRKQALFDSDSNTRSQMRGVVNKVESVSYVLEMTEDSAEVVSNMVRRSQSTRSANRCHTLPKKRYKTLSTSCYDTPKHTRTSCITKQVKLDQSDFATDSIELSTSGDNCEIIEITQNFDKNELKQMTSSTSSSSSSSSTGSNFDIESDLCSNIDAEDQPVLLNEIEIETSLEQDASVVVSLGGEGMISDMDVDDKQLRITQDNQI